MNLKKSDLGGSSPIYLQVAERVKHSIAMGELSPGEQLPTVRGLAHELRVNFNTIARAYARLNTAGIVSTEPGRGTYVRERPDDRAHAQLRADKLRIIVASAIMEAFSLGYSSGEIRSAVQESIERQEKASL